MWDTEKPKKHHYLEPEDNITPRIVCTVFIEVDDDFTQSNINNKDSILLSIDHDSILPIIIDDDKSIL